MMLSSISASSTHSRCEEGTLIRELKPSLLFRDCLRSLDV